MSGPIELKTYKQMEVWSEYKKKVKTHNSYSIKNFQYFRHNKMDEWEEELKQLTRDMREKLKVLQIQHKAEEEKEQEQEQEKLRMEGIKNTIRCEKIKETRKKNKEMKPLRKSQRIKEQNKVDIISIETLEHYFKEQNEVEIISIKTLEQRLKEKLEEAIQTGNYIDLTI